MYALVSFGDTPSTQDAALERAFVPVGFDDNDKVQITVEGVFTDSCHKVGPTDVKVNQGARTIEVTQSAYQYGGVCLPMTVPFAQVLDLGILHSGDYKIIDKVAGKELGTLKVNASTKQEPDDYLYAFVNDAYVISDAENHTNVLAIAGTYTDRCTKFKEAKIQFTRDSIIVQPIVEREANANCGSVRHHWVKRINLPTGLLGGYLLHVRSVNGQAINKLVALQ